MQSIVCNYKSSSKVKAFINFDEINWLLRSFAISVVMRIMVVMIPVIVVTMVMIPWIMVVSVMVINVPKSWLNQFNYNQFKHHSAYALLCFPQSRELTEFNVS